MNSPSLHLKCKQEMDRVTSITLSINDQGGFTASFSISRDPLIENWLTFYAKRASHSSLPKSLDLSSLTEFQKEVLLACAEIPFGSRLSYKELAEKIGRPKATRAVGSALNKNPFPLLIPCHRVIRSTGDIGDYAYGRSTKKALLDFEET